MPPIMPLSALTSALRRAGRQNLTASSVGAARKAITGSHVFRINGYNEMRRTVPTGTAISSTKFYIGGQDWQIECYPNGKDEEHRGYTSLYLTAPIVYETTARFGLTLLGAAGKPTPYSRASEGNVCFYGYRTVEDKAAGWKDFVRNKELREGGHLADDCLTVLCDVTVDKGICADEVDAWNPFNWSKLKTDVTVHAGGKTFAADRWALEAGSPVLKAALENTSELRIADMDAQVCDAMLQSLHADDGKLPKGIRLQDAAMAKGLLAAADGYGLEQLKMACEQALCTHHVYMGTVGALLALAERHGCAQLKDVCIKFLSRAGNLRTFMATDGYQQLKKDCPLIATEIVAQQLPKLDSWMQA